MSWPRAGGGHPSLASLAASLAAGRLHPSDLEVDPRSGARLLAARWARRLQRIKAERRRLRRLFAPEREAWAVGISPVAGVDEAGRGPLAGPVIAAAVVFPGARLIQNLRDSKQVRAGDREAVYDAIVASGAAIGVGVADVEEINRLNILGATCLAWSRALTSLARAPALVLLDGNIRAPLPIPQRTMIRGDARCASIAAASIVAKVTRDRWMVALDQQFPKYGFAKHKGYATAEHLRALRRWGPSPAHRQVYLPADLRQLPLLHV